MKNSEERFCKIILDCMEQYSENIMPELGGLLTSEERIEEMEKVLEQNPDEETIIRKIREIKAR